MPNQVTLTVQGADLIRERISYLERKVERHERSIERALERFGMYDEQYHEALERKLYRMNELERLQDMLRNARILSPEDSSVIDSVSVGHTVRLENHVVCYTFQIVSAVEANPSAGRISEESPIGATIMGRRLGEEVTISLPKGEIDFKIVEIS